MVVNDFNCIIQETEAQGICEVINNLMYTEVQDSQPYRNCLILENTKKQRKKILQQ